MSFWTEKQTGKGLEIGTCRTSYLSLWSSLSPGVSCVGVGWWRWWGKRGVDVDVCVQLYFLVKYVWNHPYQTHTLKRVNIVFNHQLVGAKKCSRCRSRENAYEKMHLFRRDEEAIGVPSTFIVWCGDKKKDRQRQRDEQKEIHTNR